MVTLSRYSLFKTKRRKRRGAAGPKSGRLAGQCCVWRASLVSCFDFSVVGLSNGDDAFHETGYKIVTKNRFNNNNKTKINYQRNRQKNRRR